MQGLFYRYGGKEHKCCEGFIYIPNADGTITIRSVPSVAESEGQMPKKIDPNNTKIDPNPSRLVQIEPIQSVNVNSFDEPVVALVMKINEIIEYINEQQD
jgi:hypothetical protein